MTTELWILFAFFYGTIGVGSGVASEKLFRNGPKKDRLSVISVISGALCWPSYIGFILVLVVVEKMAAVIKALKLTRENI